MKMASFDCNLELLLGTKWRYPNSVELVPKGYTSIQYTISNQSMSERRSIERRSERRSACSER